MAVTVRGSGERRVSASQRACKGFRGPPPPFERVSGRPPVGARRSGVQAGEGSTHVADGLESSLLVLDECEADVSVAAGTEPDPG